MRIGACLGLSDQRHCATRHLIAHLSAASVVACHFCATKPRIGRLTRRGMAESPASLGFCRSKWLRMLDSSFDSRILRSLRMTVLVTASRVEVTNDHPIVGWSFVTWLRMLDSNQRPAD